MKRVRKGSRIVLLRPDRTFLLLHFAYDRGALAGTDYWGLPGGGHEAGETPAAAAVRELYEETGVRVDDVGPALAETEYEFRLESGEDVLQHDWYFLVRAPAEVTLGRDGLTALEADTLVEARWWSLEALRGGGERIVPGDMADILGAFGAFEIP